MSGYQILEKLRSVFMIKKPPLAIKIWKEEPPDIPKYEGNAFPGLCTQIGEVLKNGKTFYTVRDQCFCTGGNVATGLSSELTNQERNEMIETHFDMSRSYQSIETAIEYEKFLEQVKLPVPENNAAIQLGLLENISDPDLILIFCTPGTADIINRTYCYTTGEFIKGFGGNGGCPFLIQYPYATGTPSFSYSDVAWRKYVGLDEEELTMSFPYPCLEKIIENLSFVAEQYRKYGVFDES